MDARTTTMPNLKGLWPVTAIAALICGFCIDQASTSLEQDSARRGGLFLPNNHDLQSHQERRAPSKSATINKEEHGSTPKTSISTRTMDQGHQESHHHPPTARALVSATTSNKEDESSPNLRISTHTRHKKHQHRDFQKGQQKGASEGGWEPVSAPVGITLVENARLVYGEISAEILVRGAPEPSGLGSYTMSAYPCYSCILIDALSPRVYIYPVLS